MKPTMKGARYGFFQALQGAHDPLQFCAFVEICDEQLELLVLLCKLPMPDAWV